MPVYIYESDAFDKIVAVEGERYREMRSIERMGPASFEAFLKEWKIVHRGERILSFILWFINLFRNNPLSIIDYGIDSSRYGAIYGYGGWSRYTVRIDGEIMLIAGFSTHLVSRAQEVGFRIFPEDLRSTTSSERR